MIPSPSLDPEQLDRLARPEAYPGDSSAARGIEHVQTHLSHLFLTGERVYKFRKAVDLGFVCFTSRDERNADCVREVELNRRLAPDVYLGLAPLVTGPAGPCLGSLSERLVGHGTRAPEHCVVMRRLAAGRDALALLEAGALRAEHLDRVAARVASFHERHPLGAPAPFSPEEWSARMFGPALDNFRLLAEVSGAAVPAALLRDTRERERGFRERAASCFERRRREGRAVDGHGDLHLQHIWFERDDAEPLMIDCIEFDERLRRIDGASEVAFTAMDLRYRHHSQLAERFLRVYARERDDFDLYAVVDYFVSYRAAVRAKVAAIAAGESEIAPAQRARAGESAVRHLELAARALEQRRPGRLVVVGGVVGTGKSTAAEILADELGAAVIASDRVRKRMLGLSATERARAGWRAGIYSTQHTERAYQALLERARPVLGSGRAAVLDATFACRRHRERARALAAELGAPAFFVEARCAPDVALARLARRETGAADVSDAGPDLYRATAAAFEPVDDWDEGARAVLHTDAEDWRRALRAIAADLRS